MHPGWYPDPWTPGLLRWWDGQAWTGFSTPAVQLVDPRRDLAGERVAARRASVAVLFYPLAIAIQEVLTATTFHSVWEKFRQIDQPGYRTTTVRINLTPGTSFSSLGLIAVQILVIIWLYKTATLARRAGLPSRRDPVWAILGFIIPIVNFWFPYQVAAGSFPPGDPNRRLAGQWWTWWLIQELAVIPVLIAAGFSTAAGLVVAIPAVGASAMATITARRMIAALEAAHTKLLVSPSTG